MTNSAEAVASLKLPGARCHLWAMGSGTVIVWYGDNDCNSSVQWGRQCVWRTDQPSCERAEAVQAAVNFPFNFSVYSRISGSIISA